MSTTTIQSRNGQAADFADSPIEVEVEAAMQDETDHVTAEEQVVEAVAQDAEQETARLEAEAKEQLGQTTKAYTRGLKEYRKWLFKAGEHAHAYVILRLKLRGTRKQAVRSLDGRLSEVAATDVDVNELIRTYQAHSLLHAEIGDKVEVAYGTVRDVWSLLVERSNKDTVEESWVLLPGFEERCVALYREGAEAGWSRQEADLHTRKLLREYADSQAAGVLAQETAKRAEAELAAKHAAEEKAKTSEQQAEVNRLKAETDKAKDEERALMTEKLRQQEAELRAQQQAEKEAQFQADQAAREQAKVKAEAKRVQKEQEKAHRREEQALDKALDRETPKLKPVHRESSAKSQLAKAAEVGTVKDVAESVVELFKHCTTPDDLFVELLSRLKTCGELSSTSTRAIQAALVILSRSESKAA